MLFLILLLVPLLVHADHLTVDPKLLESPPWVVRRQDPIPVYNDDNVRIGHFYLEEKGYLAGGERYDTLAECGHEAARLQRLSSRPPIRYTCVQPDYVRRFRELERKHDEHP